MILNNKLNHKQTQTFKMKQSIAHYISKNKSDLAAGKTLTIPVAWDDVLHTQRELVTNSYKVIDNKDSSFTIYHLPEGLSSKKPDQFDKLDHDLNQLEGIKISKEESLNFGNINMVCHWYSYSAHTKVQLNINKACVLCNDVSEIKTILLSVQNSILLSAIDEKDMVTLVFPSSTSETTEIVCTENEAKLISAAIQVCVETMVMNRKKESHTRYMVKKIKHNLNSEYKQDTFDVAGKIYTFQSNGSRIVDDYYILDIDELGDIVDVQTPILKKFSHPAPRPTGDVILTFNNIVGLGSKDADEAIAKFEYLMSTAAFSETYTDAEYNECQAFIRSIKEPEEIPSLEEILNKEFIKFNNEVETSEYSEVTVSNVE